MKLSARELILAWITGLVVLVLPTWFFFAAPRLEETRERLDRQETTRADLEQEGRLAEQAAVWQARLESTLTNLVVYPAQKDVTADLLIKVEGLATTVGLVLTRREPQKEKRHGDIGSLDIKCNWEGSLESLVRFLFALQQDHGRLDVGQLYVKSESRGVLKGTFTINCSYVRRPPDAPAAPAGGPAEPGSADRTKDPV